ncbi:OPN3 [Lepeophtheirus salmonis]|uniref:OPN3 n=1 Tax=Lepeophtheirus salmonis TaxID=72036 RepID=A0A7R8H1G7_LEPSM|nr:OPN3 [Lepeophtheirus salmonis]CAF2811121.1 OPN3 [Lepeophtheirus salmonis]
MPREFLREVDANADDLLLHNNARWLSKKQGVGALLFHLKGNSSMPGWKFGRFFLSNRGICTHLFRDLLCLHPHGPCLLSRCCILFISNYSLSFKQAIQSIVFIWVSTFLIAAPPLLGWGEYTPEKSGMSCAPNWETPTSLSYVIYLFVSGFFPPGDCHHVLQYKGGALPSTYN